MFPQGDHKPRYHLISVQKHGSCNSLTGEPGQTYSVQNGSSGTTSSALHKTFHHNGFSLKICGRLLLPILADLELL